MLKAFTIVTLFFACFAKAQTIKVDLDSVIVYCQYNDLIKAIKKENNYSQTTHWEGKKKIVEKDPPLYLDSLKTLKKISGDTIVLSYDIWSVEMDDETDRLANKRKLIFFDKRTNKIVTHITKITTNKKGKVLFSLYIDSDTKNKLYITLTGGWIKF